MINTDSILDPTQLLDDLRATYLSQLLVAGTTRFDVGQVLADGPLSYELLREKFGIQERSATVLLTGLCALDVLQINKDNLVELTDYGREKLLPNSPYNLRGYIGLGALGADVQKMIARLEQDSPGDDISFVYHQDAGPSALDDPEISDALTRAMAARARNVAPAVAKRLDLSTCRHLLDVGGGHGIYSLELLKKFPNLKATIIDRESPLKVAKEYAEEAGLSDRIEFCFDDIHTYENQSEAEVVLMANILHDYSEQHARKLVKHFAGQLPPLGRIVILDAFLDSIPEGAPPISTGPRPVAAYSAMLFSVCEGRCYRLDEYQSMLSEAGLKVDENVGRVPAHGCLLTGFMSKSSFD
ncbi:methyltransferase [Rubinisphaera sp.]|uniref:methyltransferase n=1 Tax=Rubinisphaera sp. TaxID=2024857 RepID=UPI000C0FF600|nr:methyltransferase [Rubinisphaera sp.]MBV09141.1 hypothetical protein [Rubinisphaera sp.]|tara:strand:+ start:2377 stop:3444 length:1068 start_codon:yes stop_codon:yes gene_type:complete